MVFCQQEVVLLQVEGVGGDFGIGVVVFGRWEGWGVGLLLGMNEMQR